MADKKTHIDLDDLAESSLQGGVMIDPHIIEVEESYIMSLSPFDRKERIFQGVALGCWPHDKAKRVLA